MLTIARPRAGFNRDLVAQTGIIPEGYQFIHDTMPLVIVDMKKALTESMAGTKIPIMKCTGVFQKSDEKNANGRIYPHKVLKDAVEKLQKTIKERKIMGELDHPPDAKIHTDRVSHLITKLWMEGKVVYGELEIINDSRCPCGALLSCLLERKIGIGISSRGIGDMEMTVVEGEDAYQVQEGYEFVTFDAVAEPSVSGTQLKINESKDRLSTKQLKEAREKLLVTEVKRMLYF